MSIPQFTNNLRADEIGRLVGKLDPIFLEIGCNDGEDTERFVAAIPHVRWFGFEPDPRAVARFIRRFGVSSNRFVLSSVAISDKDAMVPLWLSGGIPPQPPNDGREDWPSEVKTDWDLSSSICEPTGHLSYSPWVIFNRRIMVAAMRLDTWLLGYPDIGIIDFVWADVQGAEAKLIRGGVNALTRTRYLYTEFYDSPMYEGQPDLETICAMLPWFDPIGIYGGNNILLANRGLLA